MGCLSGVNASPLCLSAGRSDKALHFDRRFAPYLVLRHTVFNEVLHVYGIYESWLRYEPLVSLLSSRLSPGPVDS